jgi:simple sugar transport system substrate-binding protein
MRTFAMSSIMQHTVATLAALMMAGFAGAAVADDHEPSIGNVAGEAGNDVCKWRKPKLAYFATHAIAHPFWKIVEVGARDGARDSCLTFKWTQDVDFSVGTTIERMEMAVAEDPDVLIITATDPAAMGKSVARARAKGIPIIAINVEDAAPDQGGLDYLIYIGAEEYQMGRAAADQLIKRAPDTARPFAKPVCLHSFPGHVGLDARCKGWIDRWAEEGLEAEILDVSGGYSNAEGAISGWFIANPESNALFSFGATHQVTNEIRVRDGLLETTTFVSSELGQGQGQAIKDGLTLVAIDQQPYLQGYLAAVLARTYLDWGLMPGIDISTGPGIVTPENVDAVMDGINKGRR